MQVPIIETDVTNEDGTDTVIEEAIRYYPGGLNLWLIQNGHQLGDELRRITPGGGRQPKIIFCPKCNLLFGAQNGEALVLVDGRNRTSKTKLKCQCGKTLHWKPKN